MNGMLRMACAALLTTLAGAPAYAATYSNPISWSSGVALGQVAGWCNYVIPDERPLTIPRTLVVGNDMPNGTEIFSWNYGEAFSDFIVTCTSTGIQGGGGNVDAYMDNRINIALDNSGYILLSDSGFGLKIWARFNTPPGADYTGCGGVSVNCEYYTTSVAYPSSINNVPANTEVSATLPGYTSQLLMQTLRKYRNILSPINQIVPTYTGSISLRMSLVKIGNVQYNGPLKTRYANAFRSTLRVSTATNTISDFLDGAGITIVPPACRLKTSDYNIPMGRWAADAINYTGTPSYGTQVPVNLSLECSGKVDHVRFRFEDAGTALASNDNISLYDSAAGNKIDGLEVELFYNGTKVNVDNVTQVDTGSHGSFVSLLPTFDSTSTASFHARYVQNGAITRSGVNYTGPVTGTVNMYVTYD